MDLESRFATSCPESATNSEKTLGRHLTSLELSLHAGAGETVCFPSYKSDSSAHSQYLHQHEQSWQFGLKYLRNVFLCFFCNCSFSPSEFYFFTVFISVKTPKFQKHLVFNFTEMFIKQNSTMFSVLYIARPYSLFLQQ